MTEKESPQLTTEARNFSELVLWGQLPRDTWPQTNAGKSSLTRGEIQRILMVWKKQPTTPDRRQKQQVFHYRPCLEQEF